MKNMGTRVDGRACRISVAHYSDTMRGQSKAAPAGNRGLTDTPIEEVMAAMENRSNEERRRIAGEFLTRARDDFERAARTRISYALAARRYGMTNEAIGALLGIGESAVRALLKRHGGDA